MGGGWITPRNAPPANQLSANDFYEYNPINNSWSIKQNVGTSGRAMATGFSVGSKGYATLGVVNSGSNYNYDLSTYEYDPNSDTWARKSDFPNNIQGNASNGRGGAGGFSYGNKGFITGGWESYPPGNQTVTERSFKDIWEYNPITNSWTLMGGAPNAAVTNSYTTNVIQSGTKSYIIFDPSGIPTGTSNFFEYDPSSNTWVSKPPYQDRKSGAKSFSLCEIGFYLTGFKLSSSPSLATKEVSKYLSDQFKINGPTLVCANVSSTFSSNLAPSGSTFNWSASSNLSIVSGQGSSTIGVQAFDSFATGQGWIQLTIASPCGNITLPQVQVWVGNPPANNSTLIWTGIRGVNPVTLNARSINYYQVDNVPYTSSYTWSLPRGFTAYGSSTTTTGPQISIITSNQVGTYLLLCRANNSCGSSWTNSLTINVVGSGGGGQQMRAAFPNPANDSFAVKVKEEDSKEVAEVALFNKSMERVYYVKTEEKEVVVSTTNLLPGVYYLNVVLGKEVTQKQVVINH